MLLQLLREGLVFERLLLGQTAQKHFIIRNTSLLPVKWHMAGLDSLAPEFKVIPSSGELPARQETRIAVELTAQQKKDLADKLTLQASTCLFWLLLFYMLTCGKVPHHILFIHTACALVSSISCLLHLYIHLMYAARCRLLHSIFRQTGLFVCHPCCL